MIELEFVTSNPDHIELCRRFWKLNGDGTFRESRTSLLHLVPPSFPGDLDTVLFLSAVARDTRRRCPTCGMAQPIHTREEALAPVALTEPCSECLSLKKDLFVRDLPVDPETGDLDRSAGNFKFPVAALAILHALSETVQRRELHNGFSVHDCIGFVPAHLNRFLGKLCASQIIEKGASPADSRNMGSAISYRLTKDPDFKQDFARFTHRLAAGRKFNLHGLWDVWLDYAVAECTAFICGESILLGLPCDPENEKLCSVLRSTAAAYSIAEVWAMSRLAVREAGGLVDHGYTITEATATIPGNIARLSKAISGKNPAPQPIPRSYFDPRPRFSEWFYKWYGAYVHTRGPVVADLLQGGEG